MSKLRMGNCLSKVARRAAGLGALALSLSPTGCMQFDADLAEPVELGVHVEDWREEIIYQVLVDRFADGDAGNNWGVDLTALGKWHGGDWKGLEERLPYLEELGVTTLWISPAVKNVNDDAGFSGYHGYWTQDFTEVNPHYGDLASLRRLVRSAHERNMKIILDIVTNHVGQIFYYDINKNGQPDKDVFGGGQANQSPVVSVTEYDPEFDPRGIQARTSLGESGPAPVIFQYDPASNHVPPLPELFQNPAVYNRKGRTFNFDDLDQLVHGDFPGGLKDVDTARCDVKRAMVDIFVRWIELTDIDGFRIDTLKHVEHEFWRFFAQNVRIKLAQKGKTNFYMFGEAFDGNDELIGSFTKSVVPAHSHDERLGGNLEREIAECPGLEPLTGHMIDGVFYFSQLFQVYRDVFRDAQATAKIKTLWDARATNYGTEAHPYGPVTREGNGIPPTQTLVNFIDNHDIPRFLYEGPGASAFKADGQEVLKNALLLLLTQDGLPCIYYGTEQGFSGGNDPANREDLWQSGYDTKGELFQWIARLTRLRKGYKALTLGGQKVVYSTENAGTEEDAGMFALERALEDGSSYALVVFNTHPSKTSTASAIPVGQPQGTVLIDVLSAEKTPYTVGAGGALSVTLPAVKGALLIPEKDVNPAL